MFKKLFIPLMILAALVETTSCRAAKPAAEIEAPATNIITRPIKTSGQFNAVKAASIFNVEIKQGPAKVEITSSAEAIDATKIEVLGNILSISLSKNSSGRNGFPEIKVCVSMPDIRLLDGSGAASFSVTSKVNVKNLKIKGAGACNFRFNNIKCTDFEVDLSGASNVDIPRVDCNECELDISGGSSVDITSISCPQLNAEASGAGDISISDIKCDELEIEASGGSKVSIDGIDATDVECDASGAAHISVEGKCNKVNLKASGASKISAKKLQRHTITINKSSVATIKS